MCFLLLVISDSAMLPLSATGGATAVFPSPVNTTGAQTFLVKTHSDLHAIFTRRTLLKLLLMETVTFTINAE